MDISKLAPGDAVELLVNANAIPAGCYSFLRVCGEMSIFTLGSDIIMGFATDFWTKHMRPAVESGALLSSKAQFARGFGRLWADLQTTQASTNPSRMTFCMLSPRVLKQSGVGKVRPISASELLN